MSESGRSIVINFATAQKSDDLFGENRGRKASTSMESKYEFAAGKETPPRESRPQIWGLDSLRGLCFGWGGKFYLLLEGFE